MVFNASGEVEVKKKKDSVCMGKKGTRGITTSISTPLQQCANLSFHSTLIVGNKISSCLNHFTNIRILLRTTFNVLGFDFLC